MGSCYITYKHTNLIFVFHVYLVGYMMLLIRNTMYYENPSRRWCPNEFARPHTPLFFCWRNLVKTSTNKPEGNRWQTLKSLAPQQRYHSTSFQYMHKTYSCGPNEHFWLWLNRKFLSHQLHLTENVQECASKNFPTMVLLSLVVEISTAVYTRCSSLHTCWGLFHHNQHALNKPLYPSPLGVHLWKVFLCK